ncbi:hypothetical protein ASE73_17515 [Sphingomonas sp. Leaf24]|uniref:hypothetical protein n=1 Tax=unclassified Sphingomonas TaxID=196159 RepID=UPI0006F625A2|nr:MULTISPECIES: hypothetical protein [unclassified Sphingomonas]KQM19802.1 hypothetical protein ASE50_17405 [Sphingomonas sp. Leaf5]KQM91409.1 hypothetical protein ASE73_17515 [Sphingomonas sp. Leaf24]
MTATGQARHVLWRRLGDNALRLIAAMPVGYAVASLWAMALARILPGDPVQTTMAAALIALLLCALAAMWAYAARSGWRALWTLVVAGGIAGAITWGSIALWGRV